MPIYEYKCNGCKNVFEEFMHLGSENPSCPKCSSQTEKLISYCGGVVKGSENRSLDCIVGEDADKRRGYLEKRRERRKQNKGET
jgi:putative FmdB family regulatory protein